MMQRTLFVDRDGTLIVEPQDEQVDSLEKLRLIPGVIAGLGRLARSGFALVMVTNQDGLGTPSFPRERFEPPHRMLLDLLEGEDVRFNGILICPHRPEDACACRKPLTGLVDGYVARNPIDREHSFVIGDRETDVEFGRNIGCGTIRLMPREGAGASAADLVAYTFADAIAHVLRTGRTARVHRRTNETDVDAVVALDGDGRGTFATGIGFLDHMLEQLARHSMIDMALAVRGDLHVDEHHTVEDMGLALGSALRRALGNKAGIGRYGFTLPMDEALASVAMDLSGRPHVRFDARFTRERVGDLPTELVEDFVRALADGVGASIHVTARGRNDHHTIEAVFKALARTLRAAVAIDERRADALPTTKGVL